VRIVGVPNARVAREVAAEAALGARANATAAEIDAATRAAPGLDPEDVRALADGVRLTWSSTGADRFDAVFVPRGAALRPRARPPAPDAWAALANRPARRASGDALVPELRRHLREKLPEFMVPSAFVLLDALPLTPNGKIDRKALPAPDRARHEASTRYAAPESDVERGIASVFQELLGIDEVGIDDNFFDLGANSLMMVQASARFRAVLGRGVSLVQMFQFPTVRALAAAVGGGAEGAAVKQGQQRAQARKDALARRRDARQGTRTR
jgi:acyl carrier protein